MGRARRQPVTAGPRTLTAWGKSRSFLVRFLVDKGARGQAFLRVLRVSPVSVITPMLRIHSLVHTELAVFTAMYSVFM